MTAHQIGLIFFGWGLALAFTSVVVAPRLQRRFGTVPTLLVNLLAMSVTLMVMAVATEDKAVLATCVVVAGLFIGINNTLITETVMKAAPVERGVASAAYSFVRFSGAAMAPWLAGVLGEQVSVHMPYWVGAAAVLLGAGVLALSRSHLSGIDIEETDLDDVTRRPRSPSAATARSRTRRLNTEICVRAVIERESRTLTQNSRGGQSANATNCVICCGEKLSSLTSSSD